MLPFHRFSGNEKKLIKRGGICTSVAFFVDSMNVLRERERERERERLDVLEC